MGAALGITREWLSKLENGRASPSELILLKLAELERLHGFERGSREPRSQVVAFNEDQAPYRAEPIGPTAEALRAHLEAVIKEVDDDPRAMAYVWGQMKIHLDLDQIRKLKLK